LAAALEPKERPAWDGLQLGRGRMLVGGDDHRQAFFRRKTTNDFQDFVDQFGIERRGRFVEQQDARIRR
jgi:hypothetical protein